MIKAGHAHDVFDTMAESIRRGGGSGFAGAGMSDGLAQFGTTTGARVCDPQPRGRIEARRN